MTFSLDMAVAEEERSAPKPPSIVETAKIKAVQERLRALGYHDVGLADGIAGSRTVGAISAFQHDNSLMVTGILDDGTLAALETASPRVVSPARAEGEPEDSRIVAGGSSTAATGAIVGAPGALAFAAPLLEQAETAKGYLDRIKDLIEPVRGLLVDHWPLIAIGIGGFLVWRGIGIVRARIEDHRTGKSA